MGRGKISNFNMSGDSDLVIEEAFRRAQKAHNNKAKLVASLKNRYNKLEDKTEFHEEFIRCLKYAMIIYTREPAVENVIDFVTKFAASFETPVNENAEEEEEEDENEFLNFLFNFLLESHGANSHAVRFRVCQLVNKLLGSLSENAQIDDDLCDRIHDAMLIRVTDKYPNVRIQAALAMSRLQDPSNFDCPTIKAYMLLLENDSNPEVRRAVLSCIAPSATTLHKIYKRTRDVKEKVRKLAYQVLAEKVHIRALSIAQRVSLLHEGLSDSADSVKEVVKTDLLPAWLHMQQGDVLQLLHRLDVENCAETAVTTLQAIFSMATSPDDLLQNGVRLDERKLIPVDSLTCENVLYWRALCEFVKNKGNEGEELLEQLLPEAAIFAEYLYSYLKSITQLSEEQRADMTQLEMVMTQEYIGQQLILLVGCLDISEEGGRKRMVAVLQDILLMPNTPTSLIGLLVEKLIGIVRDDAQKIQMVAEIISDVREPILPISEPVDENEKRRKQVKLAEVRVQIMEAKQTLEECISCQDFSRAAELKDSISQLEALKNQLFLEASQPADNIKEQRVEKSDPKTLLKCLTMCAELFKQMNIKRGICPTMNALIESLILPGVSNPNPAVRNMAVICLGTAALHSKDLANTHLVLLLQITQLDEPKIRISALRALIDQLLLNGLNILQDKPAPPAPVSQDDSNGQPEHQAEEEGTIQSILKMLSEFLDICRTIRAVQPPARAKTNQECVEESFLPTLRTLFNAPVTSPLSEVDASNVAELFVELTRPSALVKPAAVQAVSVHDSLAVRVCNEILRDISAPEVRVYCKTLSWLEINSEPGPANSELQLLLKDILQEVKDKHCIRIIEKLCNQLNGDSCSKSAGNQDTTLQNLDDNNGEVNKDETKAKRAKRGQKKASTAKNGKKASKAELSSDESDDENVPEEPPSVRPSRRAKMAAVDKTKQDLTALMNQEANGS
ncbi:condensin complex subunit 3 [Sinocyclocheilus rhinocerous]|uniref:condensin complex subunit 3 n=1 Tax=Sinocyclocheilus rhinocerous TaxID=307959 RepID=UPI0007B926E9|nr:PREDICTED: condensin complex subunit 3-like [Sinocyclocheilus rhinocerous]